LRGFEETAAFLSYPLGFDEAENNGPSIWNIRVTRSLPFHFPPVSHLRRADVNRAARRYADFQTLATRIEFLRRSGKRIPFEIEQQFSTIYGKRECVISHRTTRLSNEEI
jgi:hypothetical protein